LRIVRKIENGIAITTRSATVLNVLIGFLNVRV
jgi:hypothetical protein